VKEIPVGVAYVVPDVVEGEAETVVEETMEEVVLGQTSLVNLPFKMFLIQET
jgi:hypothetical protein